MEMEINFTKQMQIQQNEGGKMHTIALAELTMHNNISNKSV